MEHRTYLTMPTATAPKGNIGSLRKIMHYVKPYKWSLIGVCIALIVTSSSVLGLGKGMAYLIDQGFSANNPALLDKALIILLSMTLLLTFATYARFFLVTYTGERVIADIRRDVYNHVLKLSPAFFEITKSGDILSRLVTDTTLLQAVVGSSLSIILRNSLLLIGGISLLVITSPKLTGYVLIIVPAVVGAIVLLGKRVRARSRFAQEKIADVTAHIDESLNGIKTIQSYTRESYENIQFHKVVKAALRAALRRIQLRALLTALVILMIFTSIGLVLWTGGHDVLSGRMTAGGLSSFIFYAIVVAGAAGALSEVIGDLQRAAGATERLFELLAIAPDIKEIDTPIDLPAESQGAIRFDNVIFNYPSRPDYASLNDFSLSISPGETVAIVGPSGAGKTTVLQLLLRFYDPVQGRILIDGVDIRDLKLRNLRSQFGLVPQDPVIFSTTVRENIRYARPDAEEEEVLGAALAASAMEFIRNLPQGMDSYLGEKGVRLSGGQRQRIAIARAILKDPKILLLDEATSSLDAESETLVQQALKNLMANRTTIVIAHRLATILEADRIIVLDQGRVDAIGTHKELLQQNGLYARLAKLQFAA